MWRRSLTDAFQITAAQAGTFGGASLMKPPRGEGVGDPSSTYTASIGQYGPCNPIRPSETLSRFRLSERAIIKLGGGAVRPERPAPRRPFLTRRLRVRSPHPAGRRGRKIKVPALCPEHAVQLV